MTIGIIGIRNENELHPQQQTDYISHIVCFLLANFVVGLLQLEVCDDGDEVEPHVLGCRLTY